MALLLSSLLLVPNVNVTTKRDLWIPKLEQQQKIWEIGSHLLPSFSSFICQLFFREILLSKTYKHAHTHTQLYSTMKNNLRSYLFDLLHSRSPDFKNVFILFAHKKNERENRKMQKKMGKMNVFRAINYFPSSIRNRLLITAAKL